MNDKTKKIVALFILIAFVFSSLAFAIISSLTGGGSSGEEQLIYNGPLSASDEQKLISQNKVVIKIFTATDCADCGPATSSVLKLFQKLGKNIIVENIDTSYFADEVTSNNLEKFPTTIILGKGSVRIEATISDSELLQKVCGQFSTKPVACA